MALLWLSRSFTLAFFLCFMNTDMLSSHLVTLKYTEALMLVVMLGKK